MLAVCHHLSITLIITQARVVQGDERGRIDATGIAAAINADDPHYPTSRLVCIEVWNVEWTIGWNILLSVQSPADPDLYPSENNC